MDRMRTTIADSRHKCKHILLLLLIILLFITLLRSQVLQGRNLANNNPPIAGVDNTHNYVPAGHSGTIAAPQNDRRNFRPAAAPKNKRGSPLEDNRFKNIQAAGAAEKTRQQVKDNRDSIVSFQPAALSPPRSGREINQHKPAAAKYHFQDPSFDTGDGSPRHPLFLKNYDWLDETIEKIRQVESGGKSDCPDGDNGRAAGPLQLHKGAVDDVNRQYGTKFTYADCHNPAKAKQIAKFYIAMWMETHKEEIACRIFNGGPRGWQKTSTDRYWKKIKD